MVPYAQLIRDSANQLAGKIKSDDPSKHHKHMVSLIRIGEHANQALRADKEPDPSDVEMLEFIAGELQAEGIN